MLVFHRDDEDGDDGGILISWVCDDVGSVGGRFQCCVGKLEVVVILLYVGKECSYGI